MDKMTRFVDTPTKLQTSQISDLVKSGVTHVGRYLGSSTSWKSISKAEADALKSAGLQIVSILEKAPTKVGYFTATQGKQDAIDAYNYAQAIGQPTGTAIYFTVDYDAQDSDFDEILTYFQAVKANLKGYVIGAYGSYSVLNFLHSKNVATYYMQTLAWSGGKKCTFINIYQSTNDKTLNGIDIDDDILMTAEVGAWGKPKPVAEVKPSTPVKPTDGQIGVVTVTTNTVIRKGADASFDIVRQCKAGEAFKAYDLKLGWYNVGSGWVSNKYVTFKKI
jgi:hypothetical protein